MSFSLETENSAIVSPFRFDFSSRDGKQLKRGVYTNATKNANRTTGNGLEVTSEGRTCKTVRGVFYVHEYEIRDNILQKAAIDFIQYCDGSTK